MSKAAYLAIFLFLSISLLFSEDTKFEGVKIRRHQSAEKRELVDKIGVLSFEDDGQKLTFRSGAGDQFAIPYSDITKVVFDTDTHGTAGLRAFMYMIAGSTWNTVKGTIRRRYCWSCREPFTIMSPPNAEVCLANA